MVGEPRPSTMADGRWTMPPRAAALDALRGLAILGMVLVALQPAAVLPRWMYHAQQPPPTHEVWSYLPGLTWPDIVFPIVLFSLGAAIPLSLGRRLDSGESRARVLLAVLYRGALLLFFAIFSQHFDASVSPFQLATPAYVLGLLAFVALSGIFTRLPDTGPVGWRLLVRVAGWMLAVSMLLLVRYPDGSGFSLERSDYILQALAHAVVWGSVVWIATRRRLLLRLAVLSLVVAFRFVAWRGGWAGDLWETNIAGSFGKFGMISFLYLVIPGTIAGDAMAAWMQESSTLLEERTWTASRAAVLLAAALAFVPVMLIGVQTRLVGVATLAVAALVAFARTLVARAVTPTERLARTLVAWGSVWMLIGLLLAEYHEGMSKIDGTLSWFFGTAGLSVMMLLALLVVTDLFRRPRAVQLLVDNGRNPLIAYVANGVLILPIIALTTIKDRIERVTNTPFTGFLRALALTILIAYGVRFFTRRGIFWRT